MSRPTLSLLGVGIYTPPARRTVDVAREAGADTEGFMGWEHVCHAGPEDHPSTMSAAALDQALRQAGLPASELSMVIAGGVSRDYQPSWSVATEVMGLCGAPTNCLGLDITIGCMGMLAGLDIVLGRLALVGGGYAAVVASERWSHTVDFSNRELMGLWSHADGGAAIVVGMNVPLPRPALAEYWGAEFENNSKFNSHVLIRYGGTRFPSAPPGMNPNRREVGSTPREELRANYRRCYGAVFSRMRARFGADPQQLLCNQISPAVIPQIAAAAEIPLERTIVTGHATGHQGSVDVPTGFAKLTANGPITEPAAIAASTAYSWGAGLLMPPGAPGT